MVQPVEYKQTDGCLIINDIFLQDVVSQTSYWYTVTMTVFFFILAPEQSIAESLKYKAEPGHYCQLRQTLSDQLQ